MGCGNSDFTQNVCNFAKLQKIYSQLVDELLRLTLRIQNIHFPFSFRTPTPHLSPKQRTFPAETFTVLDHFDKFNNFLPLKCKTSNISSGSMYCWRPIYMIQLSLLNHYRLLRILKLKFMCILFLTLKWSANCVVCCW